MLTFKRHDLTVKILMFMSWEGGPLVRRSICLGKKYETLDNLPRSSKKCCFLVSTRLR